MYRKYFTFDFTTNLKKSSYTVLETLNYPKIDELDSAFNF